MAARGTSSAYTDALDYLYARTTGAVKFGLERTVELLEHLGNPQDAVPCFHIAGTNGKGSTVATTAALLRAKGLRVGTYTSPHLVDFRERILIDGEPIPEGEVVAIIERHTDVIERNGATFFEATTALAFDHFARGGAAVTVIETEPGGRLDSTNVVNPLVAGVTSIGRDHTEYLGDSLEGIAAEKGGIFKAGRPAVIGEANPGLRDVLRRCAEDAGASRVWILSDELAIRDIAPSMAGTQFTVARTGPSGERADWLTSLIGTHQATNAAIAWLMTEAAGDLYRTSLAEASGPLSTVQLAGRFQRVGKHIFDVAHNRAGSDVLAATLSQLQPDRPVVAVFCALADKEWGSMIAALAPVVDQFLFTNAPTAPLRNRAGDLRAVEMFAAERGLAGRTIESFDAALARADRTGATVLISGSFHTVGDAMSRLQLSPLAR